MVTPPWVSGSASLNPPRSIRAVTGASSAGVVEDDAQHVPVPAVHGADPVPHLHAVVTAGAAAGSVVHREDDGLALVGAQHDRPGLLAGPLLDEHALPAGEVDVRAGEHHQELQWEGQVAVDVLV